MTIVCATHFTDSSFAAVRVAADLALKHHQPLWLVNVLSGSVVSAHGDRFEVAASEGLLLEAAALATEGVDVRTAVLHGSLDRSVGHFCTDKGALLLVVGDTSAKGGPGIAGTLDTFAYGVEIPLLVVRDPKPFDAWVRGNAPLKIMLALDHTWSSALARDWLFRLAEYGPLDLVAAHLWWPKDEYARRGLPVPTAEEGDDALCEKMLGETTAALQGLPANVKHRVHLEIGQGHIAENLLAMAERAHVDVFVLGTHPNLGPLGQLWSVSHEVLANALMSVACIPGLAVLPDTIPAERPTAPTRKQNSQPSAVAG